MKVVMVRKVIVVAGVEQVGPSPSFLQFDQPVCRWLGGWSSASCG